MLDGNASLTPVALYGPKFLECAVQISVYGHVIAQERIQRSIELSLDLHMPNLVPPAFADSHGLLFRVSCASADHHLLAIPTKLKSRLRTIRRRKKRELLAVVVLSQRGQNRRCCVASLSKFLPLQAALLRQFPKGNSDSVDQFNLRPTDWLIFIGEVVQKRPKFLRFFLGLKREALRGQTMFPRVLTYMARVIRPIAFLPIVLICCNRFVRHRFFAFHCQFS